MTDRLDSKIRALVVEMLDNPVPPPPYPEHVARIPSRPRRPGWPGWAWGLVTFSAVIVLGVIALLMIRAPDEPTARTPNEVVQELVGAINGGDAQRSLGLFAGDARCVVPGLPSCGDIIGFFAAARSRLVFESCEIEIEPYLSCRGYLHTLIHDELGISEGELAGQPNFSPAFVVEEGKITQFNLGTPFTGDVLADQSLWTYLLEIGADYVAEDGVPRFSADMVDAFAADARRFREETGG